MRGSSEGERKLSQLCLLLSPEMVVILSQLLHPSLNHPHLCSRGRENSVGMGLKDAHQFMKLSTKMVRSYIIQHVHTVCVPRLPDL